MDIDTVKRKQARIGQLTLICSICLICNNVSAEIFTNAELGYSDDDNIARAQLDTDIISDTIIKGLISVSQFSDFDDGLSLTTSGLLEHRDYQDWPGFTHTDFAINFDLRKKIGLGAFAPKIGSTLSLKQQNFDEAVRDQDQIDLRIYWQKRLSESWDVKFDLGYLNTAADQTIAAGPSGTDTGPGPGPGPGMNKPGDTFDQEAIYFGAETGVALGEIHFLVFSYQFQSGDVASSARPNNAIVDASQAITPDSAIGDGWFAYKLDANSHSLSVAWDIAISEQGSFTLEYLFQDTNADGSNNYEKNITSVQYFYSF